MSNDWQWNSQDWQQPSESDSYDKGMGSYPTQASSGSGEQAYDWEPVPPPPPPPPSSSYYSSYGQTDNPFGQPPPGGSYPFVPGVQSRPRPWFLVPLVIVLVLCAGGVGISIYAYNVITSRVSTGPDTSTIGPVATNSAATATTAAGPLTIPVNARPTIVIDRNAGAVQIQAVADSKQVVIKPVGGENPRSDGQILYSKNSDGTVITFDLSNVETVTVLVMVPTASDLSITTNGDDITVQGVKGEQNLSGNGGSLRVTDDTLMGKSTLDTNGGSITFSGTLDPQSTDHFSTNPESITITLPANASFHADITNNGGIIQSDFPQVVVSGDEAHGDVGKAPFAQLLADSNGGTILLKKGA